jgi:hypothetical protein
LKLQLNTNPNILFVHHSLTFKVAGLPAASQINVGFTKQAAELADWLWLPAFPAFLIYYLLSN